MLTPFATVERPTISLDVRMPASQRRLVTTTTIRRVRVLTRRENGASTPSTFGLLPLNVPTTLSCPEPVKRFSQSELVTPMDDGVVSPLPIGPPIYTDRVPIPLGP